MLICVKFDAGGTDRKKTFFALTKIGDILFGMIGTFLLVMSVSANVISFVGGGLGVTTLDAHLINYMSIFY